MHARTPTVTIKDPRKLEVASVSYYRNTPGQAAEPRVHRQSYDVADRPVTSRDPRLFKLLETEPDARPNLKTLFSLSGLPLYSDSVDAGSRLALFGVAGQHLIGWDSLYGQVRNDYDSRLRTVRIVEQAPGAPARNRAFYAYGDSTPASASHNRCGRLIRHDDNAGTQLFTEFALTGGVSSQTRHFLKDLQEPDWPADEAERDRLNEAGNGAVTHTVHDALGEPVRQQDAQGNVQFMELDVAGQLHQVRLQLAGQPQATALIKDMDYNASGNVERQTAGNGVVSETRYDPQDGRLLCIKAGVPGHPPLQHLIYGYDRAGNILSLQDGTAQTRYFRNQRIEPTRTFSYDSLYQLIEASGWQRLDSQHGPQEPVFVSPPDPGQLENYRQAYHYDHSGNLTTLIHSAASRSWTHQMAISRYSNRGLPQKPDGSLPGEEEIAAGFDANGNRKQLLAGQDLTWGQGNLLRQVHQVVREDAANDSEIYVYDESGQRKRKVRVTHDARNSRTREVRYLPDLEIRTWAEEVLQVISIQAGRCSVQVLHWQSGSVRADQYRYSLTNHLGSSTLELDAHADMISEEMYYPYGGTSWWAGPDKTQASYRTRRYSNQERDATGLYYFGKRYYAPWLGRWLSADPTGIGDGLNLFAMVHGNPVRFVDFQGLVGVDTLSAVGATGAREFTSALLASFMQYPLAALMAPASLGVTIAGATAGAISGGISGYASANWAQSRLSVDDPSSWAPLIAKIGGAALGAAVGAAPSLLGSLDPRGNSAAVAQIAGVFATVYREMSAQYLADVGPSNPSVGRTDLITGSASMGAVGLAGAAAGYGGAALFGSGPAGSALQSIVAGAAATGLGAAAASGVRGLRGTPTKPSKGTGPAFDKAKAVVGASSRHFFASLGQAANLAVVQIPGYGDLDANTRALVSRAISSAIGDLRSTFVTTAAPGLSAELGQTTWDVEKGTVGTAITRENVPVSIGTVPPSQVAPYFYMVSELPEGRRKYSRSQLNIGHM